MLDSFTELIPGRSKKTTDHYILYKRVNQIWLRYDNEVVKKANLAGHFRVNLAFFRHVQTSTAVKFAIDFATIKQSRVKRSVTFSLPKGDENPEKLPKLYGSKSGQKSIRAKSSAIPSTSVDTSENIEGPSADIPLVSEGATSADTPSGQEQASTSEGLKIASDVSVSEDFQFERPQATESMANVSDNTASNLVITNVRSVGVMSSSEVSGSGGLSAEDLPPLELNKWLHVSIERYPNLLKRFQEGKVKIKKLPEQDVRLTAIKSKKVSAEVFSKFYIENTSCERPEKSLPSSVADTVGNESGSSSSSADEGDNTDDDEDYVPDPSDLGGDPDGVEVKKTKAEGTYRVNMSNSFGNDTQYVGMSASASTNFRILFAIILYVFI